MSASPIPVVIIGAGPTGLTAAILLADRGIECVVLERWEGLYERPRAVHLDGEIRRLLSRMAVGDQFDAISRPGSGLRLVDRELRLLAQFDRARIGYSNGYPDANMFDQPQLEAILRSAVAQRPLVTLRSDVEVATVAADSAGVEVSFTDRTTGTTESLRAQYALGCDGANSITRAAIGTTMHDMGFEQRWLVVDVSTNAELGQWEGVHQVCDTVRPATYMRIGETRYRWEFRLSPGETAAGYDDMSRLYPLVRPWTGTVSPDELVIVRVAEYTFRAQIADRWRSGRIFLLGDAAHLTPPFIGQGMGAGLRDAANLSWKLAAVLAAELPEKILDSYERERKPHARTMIRAAKLIGTVMTGGGDGGNVLRRLILPQLRHLPGLQSLITSGETPRLRRSDLVVRPLMRPTRAGRLVPNVPLDSQTRYDDLAGGRYAIITTINPSTTQSAQVRDRGGVFVVAGPTNLLHGWLHRRGTRAALVRPDGTVQRCAGDLATLCGDLPRVHSRPSAHDRFLTRHRP